jgi:hypothetical protein
VCYEVKTWLQAFAFKCSLYRHGEVDGVRSAMIDHVKVGARDIEAAGAEVRLFTPVRRVMCAVRLVQRQCLVP